MKGDVEELVCLVKDARSMLVAFVKLIVFAAASSLVNDVNEVNAPKSTDVIFDS